MSLTHKTYLTQQERTVALRTVRQWFRLADCFPEPGQRVWVKTMLNDPDPAIASVYPLWKGADWLEREVFDMYGIRFEGHPDLRRILMPEQFTSFPLRKDYPLRGRGERHNFPTVTRAEG